MKIIEAYDDLDWARDQTKTPATTTATISYDGATVELDLGEANKKSLDEQMAELFRAGRRITTPGRTSAPSFRREAIHESRLYHKQLRNWADKNHLKSKDGTRPAYITPSGSTYYPAWLVQRYEEHLAGSP